MSSLMFEQLGKVLQADKQLWLVVVHKERADATPDECVVCGGLRGAIQFPHLSSLQSDTLTDAVDDHDHYKHVDVEVLRVPAHVEAGEGCTRIVPDQDRPFTSPKTGWYRLAVHDGVNGELMSVELPPMPAGSTLDSLVLRAAVSGEAKKGGHW